MLNAWRDMKIKKYISYNAKKITHDFLILRLLGVVGCSLSIFPFLYVHTLFFKFTLEKPLKPLKPLGSEGREKVQIVDLV